MLISAFAMVAGPMPVYIIRNRLLGLVCLYAPPVLFKPLDKMLQETV